MFQRFVLTRSITVRCALVACALTSLVAAPAFSTWSIVAADDETQEVAVGSATCVTGIDLRRETPAVVVGLGAGAAQSFVDVSGQRRQIMFDGLNAGIGSDAIIAQLQALPNAASNQHGVADTGDAIGAGDSGTDTGASTFDHASGVVGRVGSIRYAIQGNILTGSPVVTGAETAFVTTAGDLAERLMAAMEAARAFGGDGRCSCPGGVTTCGSPPPMFDKSADVGYMIVARFGDTDDPACNTDGCADGGYYMSLNVANASSGDPDPVLTLRTDFDAFRASRVGAPDAIASEVDIVSNGSGLLMRIVPRDWQGTALAAGTLTMVSVVHAPVSDQATTVGAPVALPDGSYEVALVLDAASGDDVFTVTLEGAATTVVLPPRRASLGLTFADGFESGNTSAWSSATP